MPNVYGEYPNTIVTSLQGLWDKIVLYLPNLVVALIVLILGWIIGAFLGRLLRTGLEAIGIDSLANKLGLQELSKRTGHTFSISRFVQWVVKWFFFLGSFIAAADILGLTQVTQFFYSDVLGYAGHVVVAMAILLLGILAANFFSEIIESALRASNFAAAPTLGSLTRWAIVIFSIIAGLSELQIAQSFLQDLFRAIVAMIAIAGGVSFGWAGRDQAKRLLDSAEQSLTKRS